MPINKIYVGTSLPKSIYVGTSQAKMVYVGTKLVYTRPQTVSLTLNTGVAGIQYSSTEADGTTGTGGTATTSTSVTVGYGSSFSATATAATGYTMNTSTYGVTVDGNESWSPTATRKTFTVTISKGTGVSSFSWTRTKWNGGTTTGTTSPVTVEYGDSITITGTATSAAYNTPSSITYSNITSNKTASLTTTYKTFTVTISKGTGVSTVYYDVWDENGNKTTTSGTSGTVTVRYNGKIQCTSATYSTGYEAKSSDKTQYTITAAKTISWTAKKKVYTVTIRIRYNNLTYTSKVGTVSGTYTNSSGTSTTLSAAHAASLSVQHGGFVNISATPVAGFAYSSGAGNYTNITANKTIDVVFVASTSTTSFTINNGTATTNTISKSGFTVTASLAINLAAAAAGATLATVPSGYRPSSAKTVTNASDWYTASSSINGSAGTTTPTITIATSGAVSSNKQSFGPVTVGGGGKWGGGSGTVQTVLQFTSLTWTV